MVIRNQGALEELLSRAGLKAPHHVVRRNFEFVPDDNPGYPVYGFVTGLEPVGEKIRLEVSLSQMASRPLKFFIWTEDEWFAVVVPSPPASAFERRRGTLTISD